MPRVRLDVRRITAHPPQSYIERDGSVHALRLYQLTTRIEIGRISQRGMPDQRTTVLDAVVDTGAPLSSFPRNIWSIFEQQIEWLELHDAGTSPVGPFVSIAGHRYPFRLGRIVVTVADFEGRRLTPAPILALFLDEPPGVRPPPVLLGLSRGILEGRRMWLGPSLDEHAGQNWWLEDR